MNRTVSLFLCFLMLAALFSSCTPNNSAEQVEFYPEMVKYNLVRSDSANEFSFNMNVISSTKKPKIEFISAEGENTEYLTVTFSDDTFKDIAKKTFDGKYVILLGVHCIATSEYTEIQSMKISVDGNEKNIIFSTPIKNTFLDYGKSEHHLSQRNMPMYIFPQSFVGGNETDYAFSLAASNDVKILSFGINDFIELSGAKLYVNGKLQNDFPLTLKEGDVFTVESRLKAADANITNKENFYVNIIAEYEYNGTRMKEFYPLSATFIGNEADAKEFVSFVKS